MWSFIRLFKLCRIHRNPLKSTSFGKPNPFAFKNAEAILVQILSSMYQDQETVNEVKGHQFSTIYMIGDNPAVGINRVIKVCLKPRIVYYINCHHLPGLITEEEN